jgi:hypothetical protein
VPSGGSSVAIRYTVSFGAVSANVVGSDGMPVSGARVTLTALAQTPVADVTVGGITTTVQGRVARVVTTDLNGNVNLQLPAGDYEVVVEPTGPSMDGLTTFARNAAASPWMLALQKPIALSGVVTGDKGQVVVGARVTAIETKGLGAAPWTTTGADGSYGAEPHQLWVDAGSPVTLLVEPGASDKLAGARVALAAGTTHADVKLAPGLLVTGVVRSPTGSVMPAVRVEAICYACGPTATPVATAITGTNGVYLLYLADPGDGVDGGVPPSCSCN